MKLQSAIPFIDKAPAELALATLLSHGIDASLVLGTAIDLTSPPSQALPKSQGLLLRAYHEHLFRNLLLTSSNADSTRLRSAAGTGNGEWLRDAVESAPAQFTDNEFLVALKWRLGLPIVPPHSRCSHHAAADNTLLCNKPLDVWCSHAVTCNVGGGPTNLVHNPIASLLAQIM
jgi:hypothetical protein